MRIRELFDKGLVTSLEIFPPKPKSPIDTIISTISALSDLKPDFISVTYGACGSEQAHTFEIAQVIKTQYGIESLAHLTCINSKKEGIDCILEKLSKANVKNILALRGDIPKNTGFNSTENRDFKYARDLVEYVKESGKFCIGGACYPEGHIECADIDLDLHHLKEKVNSGIDFLITQLFFDNNFFYDFREKLGRMNISVPVSVGIMPVLNKKQIEKITTLCGASIPRKLRHILNKYEYKPKELRKAGIVYATEQIIELLSMGIDGIHLYTMNRPEVATNILGQIRKH